MYSQIYCPNCLEERKLSKLHLHGYRYRRVLSLDRYYYLLYRRLHCPLDQGKGQLRVCGGSFSEHSPNIIRQLTSYLSNIVPCINSSSLSIDKRVVHLMRSAIANGMNVGKFSRTIKELHEKHHSYLHLLYIQRNDCYQEYLRVKQKNLLSYRSPGFLEPFSSIKDNPKVSEIRNEWVNRATCETKKCR